MRMLVADMAVTERVDRSAVVVANVVAGAADPHERIEWDIERCRSRTVEPSGRAANRERPTCRELRAAGRRRGWFRSRMGAT